MLILFEGREVDKNKCTKMRLIRIVYYDDKTADDVVCVLCRCTQMGTMTRNAFIRYV